MKRACLRLTPLLLIWLLSGCAAALDHYSGRFRETLAAGESRTTIRAELGEPQLCQQATFLTEDKVQGCDRFTVLGKIHKRGDGNGQATASAVTMGLGELILVPMTVASLAADYTEQHTITVYYDRDDHYLFHTLLNGKGQEVWQ
ncbi:hypothetical protein JD541_06205 [Aeromonas dhakensis]|uniref:hypothetical protein n=1 Tax=Aeromonas dhakensis TaxID=196024 RepID=UPI001115F62A|nr:hypothetical protein [Aeromonas dhakensis]MBL0532583.1 hypothetical protein [Aeromonas dhakensis]TNI35504.1 hypothetical protein CF131_04405 [Aeromonas dhakensis]TNI44121.1 hypothetical protein CF130_12000 [Aeromonas dhakensis]